MRIDPAHDPLRIALKLGVLNHHPTMRSNPQQVSLGELIGAQAVLDDRLCLGRSELGVRWEPAVPDCPQHAQPRGDGLEGIPHEVDEPSLGEDILKIQDLL